MHIGYNNKCTNNFIDHTEIQSADKETDLDVVVHKTLKIGNQCNKVVKEAYSVLGLIYAF